MEDFTINRTVRSVQRRGEREWCHGRQRGVDRGTKQRRVASLAQKIAKKVREAFGTHSRKKCLCQYACATYDRKTAVCFFELRYVGWAFFWHQCELNLAGHARQGAALIHLLGMNQRALIRSGLQKAASSHAKRTVPRSPFVFNESKTSHSMITLATICRNAPHSDKSTYKKAKKNRGTGVTKEKARGTKEP